MSFPQQISYGYTNAAATSFSNQKKVAVLATGRMVAVIASDGTNGDFQWSDDGYTWTDYGADIAGWANGSIASYVDTQGAEWLVAVWKQSGTGGGRTTGYVYMMVGRLNDERTAITWGTAVAVIADTQRNYPDVVAHAEGSGGALHIAYSTVAAGPTNRADIDGYAISSSGVIGATLYTTASSSNGGVSVETWPSIDIDPATKRLFVASSAGTTGAGKGIRFRTAAYAAGAWTWATEVEVDTTLYLSSGSYPLVCRWDGTRVVIGVDGYDGAASDHKLYESTNFTSFTTRNLALNHAAAGTGWFGGGMAVDPATGDVYFIGRAAPTVNGLGYMKWTRATTTLGTWTLVDQNGNSAEPYANAWYYGGAIRWVYTAGNNSPYAVKYDLLALATTARPVSDLGNPLGAAHSAGVDDPGLYDKIDETAASDADYITLPPATAAPQVFEILLGPIQPAVAGGTLRYRLDIEGGPVDVTGTVSLVAGSTVIKSESRTLPTALTTYEMTISSAEAATIADWNNLRLRLEYSLGFDPMSIAWNHAYWASGPEFAALGLADGAAVSSWPDEVSTDNLAQATGTRQPLLVAASTDFAGRPVVRFDGSDDYIGAAFASSLAQPCEWVVVGRYRTVPATNKWVFDSPSGGRQIFGRISSGSAYAMNAGTASPSGGTIDAVAHCWRLIFNGASSDLYIDNGADVISSNPGTNAADGLRLAADNTGANVGDIEIAFIAVKQGALTTQERADMLAWAQATYGTP